MNSHVRFDVENDIEPTMDTEIVWEDLGDEYVDPSQADFTTVMDDFSHADFLKVAEIRARLAFNARLLASLPVCQAIREALKSVGTRPELYTEADLASQFDDETDALGVSGFRPVFEVLAGEFQSAESHVRANELAERWMAEARLRASRDSNVEIRLPNGDRGFLCAFPLPVRRQFAHLVHLPDPQCKAIRAAAYHQIYK